MSVRDYVFMVLLLGVSAGALYFLLPAYTEHRQASESLGELRRGLSEQEEEIRRLRKEISALRTDYRAVERVAREKFGWCREGEKIYHFDPPATPEPARGAVP